MNTAAKRFAAFALARHVIVARNAYTTSRNTCSVIPEHLFSPIEKPLHGTGKQQDNSKTAKNF
jgi:hypothetical protein